MFAPGPRRIATRRRLLAVVVAALVVLGGGASSFAQGAAPPGFVGISAQDVFAGGAHYRATALSAMRAAGITLVRGRFDWSAIEIRRGVYNFSAYDATVLEAAKLGIQIMPILFNEPRYLSARPRTHARRGTYPPKDLASIAVLARAAVRWYGPGGGFWARHSAVTALPIRVWQIWDEPNLNIYWEPKPNAAQYVTMLQSAAQAIHAIDPGAEVVSAGIPQSPLGVPLITYLTAMLAAGGGSWIDTLGVNAYSPTPGALIEELQAIRATLDAHGGTNLALRVTEFGWSDNGPGGLYRLSPQGDADAIATVIPSFYNDRSQLDLLGFVYYDWRDATPRRGVSDFWGLHTGLLNRAGKPKPALRAFSEAANAL